LPPDHACAAPWMFQCSKISRPLVSVWIVRVWLAGGRSRPCACCGGTRRLGRRSGLPSARQRKVVEGFARLNETHDFCDFDTGLPSRPAGVGFDRVVLAPVHEILLSWLCGGHDRPDRIRLHLIEKVVSGSRKVDHIVALFRVDCWAKLIGGESRGGGKWHGFQGIT
jgi:hypothetical protein